MSGDGAPDRFRTERLVAERLTAEHWAELRAMDTDPRVMATLGGLRSEQQSRDYLQRNLEHWRSRGFGIWMLRTAEGAFAGRAGLRQVEVEGEPEVELAYALVAELHGRGLATEIARAILEIAFDRLGLEDLIAFTLPTNLGSRRVIEKCGFGLERDIEHEGRSHVLYRLRRPESGAVPVFTAI